MSRMADLDIYLTYGDTFIVDQDPTRDDPIFPSWDDADPYGSVARKWKADAERMTGRMIMESAWIDLEVVASVPAPEFTYRGTT